MTTRYVYWALTENEGWECRLTKDPGSAPLCSRCGNAVFPPRNDLHERLDVPHLMNDPHDRLVCETCGGDEYARRKDPQPDSLLSQLGGVQQAVLAGLDALSKRVPYKPQLWGEAIHGPADPENNAAWVRRTELTDFVASRFHDWGSDNAASSAVSRAVFSLIDRGHIVGAYRGWVTYRGEAGGGLTNPTFDVDCTVDNQGDSPAGTLADRPTRDGSFSESGEGRRPTLELVRFGSREGQQTAILATQDLLSSGGNE